MKKVAISIILSFLTISGWGQGMPPEIKPSERPWVHDPVIAEENGVYRVFSTGRGIPIFESIDMKYWRLAGHVDSEGRDLWAPDIIFRDGQWHLFYSKSSFGKNDSYIGHMTNKTLDRNDARYHWTDHGAIIESTHKDNYNCIDPNVVIDEENQAWLVFGSFWDGIKMVRLTDDLMSVSQPREWYSLARRPKNVKESPAIEAPFIVRHDDYYYLFVSLGFCCRGTNSTYRVVVGRSENVTGPYIDREGVDLAVGGETLVIEGDKKRYSAIGHNAVATFEGKDYFVAHAYDITDGSPHLIILPIEWVEGWPEVSY